MDVSIIKSQIIRLLTGIPSLYHRMALEFLTKTGQTCTDLRQEFILLSDIFGWSALVDSLNHPTPKDSTATEATVLGPFFVEDSKDVGILCALMLRPLDRLFHSRYLSEALLLPKAKGSICMSLVEC